MTNTTQRASVRNLETRKHAFVRAIDDGQMLFSVNDGVPLLDAVQMAQTYLSAARQISVLVAQDVDNEALYGVHYLCELASAVLDSITQHAADVERGLKGESV